MQVKDISALFFATLVTCDFLVVNFFIVPFIFQTATTISRRNNSPMTIPASQRSTGPGI
jgi:hypothetical protein